MVRKNTRSQGFKQNAKILQKQTKIKKIAQKKTKKPQVDESQIDDDQSEINQNQTSQQNNKNDSQQSDQDNQLLSDQSSGLSQEQSSEQLAPENYAVKQMSFRQRRGTKMNYLMNRKKQEEEDPFWQNQGQNYFGDLEDQEADEDYQQSSSGRDEFDSDFGQTESEPNEQEQKIQEPQVDDHQAKQRKKNQELMREIGARGAKKATPKTATSTKKVIQQKKPVLQVGNRYIHQVCTQQQLLGEAAQTEYINWLSLQKLISIQNQKKDFSHKEHFVQGKKVIFRDRITPQGKRATTYQLVGVEVNKVSDITQIMNQQGELCVD